MGFRTAKQLDVEEVGEGLLILRPGSAEVLQLEGAQVAAFRLAQEGATEVPESLESAMAGLIELGLVETDVWTRRRVMQLGGAAAAAAVAVIALPSVAAAASGPGSPPTDPPVTTGTVDVHLDLKDGLTKTASSPFALPPSGTQYAYLYSSADRNTTPVASVAATLPANQTYLAYSFTGVTPGTYYVDIQQPFDALGAAGITLGSSTVYVDWNYGHRSVPTGYPPKVAEYQQVTVTAGGTATVTKDIQVALEFTPPPWP